MNLKSPGDIEPLEYKHLSKEELIDALVKMHLELKEMEEYKTEVDWLCDCLKKRTHMLNERIKELNCIYRISRLLSGQRLPVWKTVKSIVDILPNAWQYPEITCARAVLRGKEYKTRNFHDTLWKLSSPIVAGNKSFGLLEVRYLRDKNPDHKNLFLKEERELLDAVALCLGTVFELADLKGDASF